jgi:septum formation topological specificity factor MinE
MLLNLSSDDFKEYICDDLNKIITAYMFVPIDSTFKSRLKNEIIVLMMKYNNVTKCDIINFKSFEEKEYSAFECDIEITYNSVPFLIHINIGGTNESN